MAKKSDQRASDLGSENTGGLLSGLLAEEEHLDRRAMFRLGTWGAASVGAVVVAVLANQSQIGLRREQVAAADLARQSLQIQSVAKESQNETRRLASAIDTLNSDRDRLYSRVSTLEQGLDSVTGSIARQSAAAASPPPSTAAAPAATAPASVVAAVSPASAAPTPSAPAAAPTTPAAQNPTPAPVAAPVATTAAPPAATPSAPAADKPQTEAKSQEKSQEKTQEKSEKPPEKQQDKPQEKSQAKPQDPAPAAVASAATSAPPMPTAPLMPAKSIMGPPDPAAQKLIEPAAPAKADAATPPPLPAPEVIASAPPPDKAASKADEPASPQLAVKRTEFGVDVGGANSVSGLRALWRGLLKSRSNAPLAALQPIIVVKEGNNGLGMQLRLVAGPLTDAATAAKICAVMVENERPCQTTVFDGQRLAMSDEPAAHPETTAEKPAPTKPASGKTGWRRHGGSKRAVEEVPPPKPEASTPSTTSSTLSSFFGRR
jgi:hypothetical protein